MQRGEVLLQDSHRLWNRPLKTLSSLNRVRRGVDLLQPVGKPR
jgi:hypothetical protein